MSLNTIKSYIRSAYGKIGVDRRTDAVRWAAANGFELDTERTVDPPSGGAPPVPVGRSPPALDHPGAATRIGASSRIESHRQANRRRRTRGTRHVGCLSESDGLAAYFWTEEPRGEP